MSGPWGKIHNKDCCCAWVCCPNIGNPSQLHLTLITISNVCGCLNGQVVTLDPDGSGFTQWVGVWEWPCSGAPIPSTWFRFTTNCNGGQQFLEIIVSRIEQLATDPPPDKNDARWANGTGFVYQLDDGQCDPFYWHYNGVDQGDGVWVRCDDDFPDSPEIQMELTL